MTQAIALAAVQDVIARKHPDKSIQLVAQVHYIRPNDVAHIDVYGCNDAATRRSIRAEAVRLLLKLGFRVELVGSHDVFTIPPDFSDPGSVLTYCKMLAERLPVKLADLPINEQTYLRDCSSTGAYIDPQRLSVQLRERVETQALRQRPIVDGRIHYYVIGVVAELE